MPFFFKRNSRWITGAALAVSPMISGCGGGGSGGSTRPTPVSTPIPTTPPVAAQLLFDDFSGGALDANRWGSYIEEQQLQRTYFGFTPQLLSENGTSFARLRFDTFNSRFPGFFKGTEIFTKQRFARGEGLEIEARLRGPDLPPGIILAFFGIFDRFNGTPSDATYSKSEIDFEFLSAEQEQFSPPGQRRRLYLNIWDDWNLRDGFDGDDVETPSRLRDDKTYQLASDPNFDWANWNTYTIRWLPDRTEFLVNGNIERIEREVKPDEDLSVHFNMWTGIPDFAQAYSASLQAARSESDNRSYFYDVDFVRVRSLGPNVARVAAKIETPLAPGLKSYRNR